MKFVFRRTFAIVRITPAAAFDFTTAPLGLPARKSFGSIWKMMIKSLRCLIGSFPTRHEAGGEGGVSGMSAVDDSAVPLNVYSPEFC